MTGPFFLIISTLVWIYSAPLSAKDFGRLGQTFEIKERDLLRVIQDKLTLLSESGALEAHQTALQKRSIEQIKNPPPLNDLKRATQTRTFAYDPTLVVAQDLKDHRGQVFHKKGTRLNPLDQVSLKRELIFLDARDRDQIAWVTRQGEAFKNAKIILTGGSPFEWMETWQRPVYFDQGGVLTKKLGIQAVPAVVRGKGRVLEIQEMCVTEETPA